MVWGANPQPPKKQLQSYLVVLLAGACKKSQTKMRENLGVWLADSVHDCVSDCYCVSVTSVYLLSSSEVICASVTESGETSLIMTLLKFTHRGTHKHAHVCMHPPKHTHIRLYMHTHCGSLNETGIQPGNLGYLKIGRATSLCLVTSPINLPRVNLSPES